MCLSMHTQIKLGLHQPVTVVPISSHILPLLSLTVAVVKEVGDGGRGAAAPGLGCVDGGQDGRHESLVLQ